MAPPPPTGPRAAPPVRSRRRLAVAIGGATLVVGALALAAVLDAGSARQGASPTSTPATDRGRATTTSPTGATPTSSRARRACPAGAWSRRDRLAQLLMVGVDPADPAEARRVVEVDHLGGIFLGGSATGTLLSGELGRLRGLDGVRPLVAVDGEGGRVQRIDEIAGDLPSARELAATASLSEIRALGAARGRALAELGVTTDFAPVLDVSSQADGDVIGDRSYGADPATVVRNARAFAQGLRDGGIQAVYKHFPGHGRAVGDSHDGTSTAPPLDQLGPDLAPYRTLLAEPEAEAVMVGHLVVPGLTDGEPASLSGAAIDGLLRDDLGFEGLVFTDELGGMRAVSDRYGAPEAVRRSLAAGADVALLAEAGDLASLLDHLEQAVADGSLPEPQVDASVARVLAAKGYDCSG